MRRIFPLVAVALLAAGSAAAQTASRTTPELGSRTRVLLLNTPVQRSGGVERSRALQAGAGAPTGLGSTERRNVLRSIGAAGTSRTGAAGQESLGSVERTTLLRRGPVSQRPAAQSSAHTSGRVLAHRLRRRG